MSVGAGKEPFCTVRLRTVAGFLVFFLPAGCGLYESGDEPGRAPRREAVAPGQSARPMPSTVRPGGGMRVPRSPQQMAALDRLERARALIAQGEYGRAVSHLEKTLAMDSTNPQTYFQLARAHYGLSNFRESLEFLEVAESLFGDERRALTAVWVLKGDNLRGLGQRPQARHSYERALAIDPRNQRAVRGLRLVAEPS